MNTRKNWYAILFLIISLITAGTDPAILTNPFRPEGVWFLAAIGVFAIAVALVGTFVGQEPLESDEEEEE